MFNISADFNSKDVADFIQQETEAWFNNLLEPFRVTGKDLVDRARAQTKDDGGFGNITWNLRASICMALAYKGEIVEVYSPPINKGEHGTPLGKDIAQRLAIYSAGQDGIVMAIVAAEEYALFVERKGKDVITHVVGDNIEKSLTTLLK